jgi:hypothetical protein
VSLLAAGYLGGAACYCGVLLAPLGPRLPVWYVAVLALVWPAAVVLALAGEERHG